MLSKLTNWGGYACILGGVLFAVAVVLHPLRDGMSVFESGAAYGVIHNVGVFGLMLQLFGLVAIYVNGADTLGQRGLNSYVVLFFGQLFYICLLVLDGIANPILSIYAPEVVHSGRDVDPNFLTIVLPALLLYFVGYLLFGASLLSAKEQSRAGTWLITLGAPIYIIGGISIFVIGPSSYTVSLIEIAGAVPQGLGYILLGLKLISGMKMQIAQQSYST
jgi:hypothetical protein